MNITKRTIGKWKIGANLKNNVNVQKQPPGLFFKKLFLKISQYS